MPAKPTAAEIAAARIVEALAAKGWVVCSPEFSPPLMVNPRTVIETIAAVFMENDNAS